MSKKQNIEEVFKQAHLAAKKQPEPVFSPGWQSRVMDDVRRTARLENAPVNDEVPLNLFAFRLGWAMLGFAFAVSAVFYAVGINTLDKMEKTGDSSLWECVDQGVNASGLNLIDKTDKVDGGSEK